MTHEQDKAPDVRRVEGFESTGGYPHSSTHKTHPTGTDRQNAKTDPRQNEKLLASFTLDDLEGFFARFVVFAEPEHRVAVVLWAVHTHLVDRLRVTPYLHLTSPEPESGKSQTLDVLALVVREPWQVIMPSEPVLFRKINKDAPTLLLDEVDPIFSRKSGNDSNAEGLRAVLNAGYQRGRPVPRCVGPSHDVKDFEVYGAKAIAGLGDVPDTIASRSIRISMKRRRPDEPVEPLFPDEVAEEADALRARIESLAESVELGSLRAIRRRLLDAGLGDRAADGWASLMAVAYTAGGEWAEHGMDAAVKLSARTRRVEASAGIRLLSDIASVITDDEKSIHTKTLLERLHALEESPWSEWARGNPITARGVAKLLNGFDVFSKQVYIDGVNRNGYEIRPLRDSFERYIGTPSSKGLEDESQSGFSEDSETLETDKPRGYETPNEPTDIGVPRPLEDKTQVTGSETNSDPLEDAQRVVESVFGAVVDFLCDRCEREATAYTPEGMPVCDDCTEEVRT